MRLATRAAVRRFTLVALFALAAQALLPYLHANVSREAGGRATHAADCAVCAALAHGGARSLDTPTVVSVALALVSVANRDTAPVAAAPSVDADTASARAPPASHRHA
jgi:hypothetical protein